MKQKITLTLETETHKMLKDEAKSRNMTLKKLGEEYFHKLIDKLKAKEEAF